MLQGPHPTLETDPATTGVLPHTMGVTHRIREEILLTLAVVLHTTEVAPPIHTTWATLASRATSTLPIIPYVPLRSLISPLESLISQLER